jgi:hypothetical protein
LRVNPNFSGLPKRSGEVFSCRQIDADLSTDCAVDLSYERGWDDVPGNPPHESRRGKSGQVSDDAAADGNQATRPIETRFRQCLPESAEPIRRFGALTRRETETMNAMSRFR